MSVRRIFGMRRVLFPLLLAGAVISLGCNRSASEPNASATTSEGAEQTYPSTGGTATAGVPSAAAPHSLDSDRVRESESAASATENAGKETQVASADARSGSNPATSPTDSASPLPASPGGATGPPQASDAETPGDSAAGIPAGPPPLFEGWPEPQLVFLVTGRQHGYIEPCGCTGLTNQKGGLARRHRLHTQLVEKGWNVVPIDAGNQVRRFGRQAEIKFQMTVEALSTMGYRAVAFGPDDLKLSTGELVAMTVGDESSPSPFVSANVGIIDRSLTPTYRIVEAGGKKIGITSALGDSHRRSIQSDEVVHRSAQEGLQEVWPELEQQQCDLYVLLAHASIEESKTLAAAFPGFDIVVTAGGAGEPTNEPEPIAGTDAVLVQVGTKGMFAGVVGVFDDEAKPLRYQRVPLDARFEDTRHMLQLLAAYQQQLESDGLEGLGLRPIPHPSGREFVGSRACSNCHRDAYKIWKETPHAHATESLVHPGERSEIPRHFDPECLSCHVTGWNPQKFFPYTSGYLSLEETPKMTASGCENCHGPGSRHVAAERGTIEVAEDELLKLRAEMRLPYEAARDKCLECHDLDNSPDFHVPGAFEEYWEQVAH